MTTALVFAQKAAVNGEETMLGFEEHTQYDQIPDMLSAKEPFDRLWAAAVNFHAHHDKWMNGPLLQVDAEEVEEEVSE